MDLTVHGYKWNRDEIKIVWKEDLWYKKKSLSESFELRFTMHDTQFHGVPVKNFLCSCIPDIPTYILELFLQNIPGTEISIYVKLYLYLNQQSSIEN